MFSAFPRSYPQMHPRPRAASTAPARPPNAGICGHFCKRGPHFGLLPAVYYPSFRLSYFCIEKENNHLVISYVAAPKMPERELTWLQRLVTLGKAPKPPEVPPRTIVDL